MRVSIQRGLAALCASCIAFPFLVYAAPETAPAAATALAKAAVAPSISSAETPPAGLDRTRLLTLNQMGSYGPLALRGPDPTGYLGVDVRGDEIVTGAKLKLDFTYSPALVFSLSHLRVLLNGDVIATIPLDKDDAGKLVSRVIDLPPQLFTDYNRIGVQMIAHYSVDMCEDPYHSSLWVDVSPSSSLELTTQRIALHDSLALLPAPFFDKHDNRLLTLPFMLPSGAQPGVLAAAGVVSSWFGALADYRHARFPVVNALPADSHAVVFAMPNAMPAGLVLPEIKGPTVSVVSNPASPADSGRKLLVVAGRDEKELKTAAEALALGRVGMAGSSTLVQSVDIGAARKPYDAPRWAPLDRPVLFRDLVSDPQQLQVSGFSPNPVRVNLRVPPDLYAWAHQSVPLEIRYRYTAPSTYNDSSLAFSINDLLVRSERLRPLASSADRMRINVPLLTAPSDSSVDDEFGVPVFRVGANNQFQFKFHMDSQKTGLCTSTATDIARAAIDPNSSIDFSAFAHFTALPNLSFFSTGGFPFTRMADLADTAVVVPDAPDAREQEAVLTLLGDMGRWTGLPALRVDVVPAKNVDAASNRDLLVIGTGSSADLLAKWGKNLPLLIGKGNNQLSLREQRNEGGMASGVKADEGPLGRASLDPTAPMAALIGFESPLSNGRSVVALTATSSAQLGSVLDTLQDDGKLTQVRGDLTVFRDKQIDSLRVGNRYFVGDLPWYARMWIFVSNYPALLAIAGILAGIVVALMVFWALSRLAVRRTEN